MNHCYHRFPINLYVENEEKLTFSVNLFTIMLEISILSFDSSGSQETLNWQYCNSLEFWEILQVITGYVISFAGAKKSHHTLNSLDNKQNFCVFSCFVFDLFNERNKLNSTRTSQARLKYIESFSVPPTHSWLLGVMVMMSGWWSVGSEFKHHWSLFDLAFLLSN